MTDDVNTPDPSDTSAEDDGASGPTPAGTGETVGGRRAAGAKGVAKLAGAASGHARALRASNARMVAEVIERTHTRQAKLAASRSSFLQETAAKVQAGIEKAAGEGTRAGGREQLKGHFIESNKVRDAPDESKP